MTSRRLPAQAAVPVRESGSECRTFTNMKANVREWPASARERDILLVIGYSIACLLLYEDYVWVSLGNAMKAKQSKASTWLLRLRTRSSQLLPQWNPNPGCSGRESSLLPSGCLGGTPLRRKPVRFRQSPPPCALPASANLRGASELTELLRNLKNMTFNRRHCQWRWFSGGAHDRFQD
jgi:hypothetical protein